MKSTCIAAALVAALALTSACGDDDGADDDDDVAGVDAAGGGTPDAGPPAACDLPGTAGEWTWVPVAGTQCMDGSATGFGVNPGRSDKIVLFMEGGGACFNDFTCGGVAHPNGFDDGDLAGMAETYGSRGIFNRDDQNNPVRDWTFIFMPYCTGDIFAGNAPEGVGGRVQVGYVNVGLYLDQLVPACPDVDQVLLTGTSAGGFGALYNYDRVAEAYGEVPVQLLDDSGPPMSSTYLTTCLQELVREAWNLDATIPDDCTDCLGEDGGLVNALTFLAEKYSDRRLGLVSANTDGVIRLFYGQGYPSCENPQIPMPPAAFTEGLDELRDEILAPYTNFRMFTVDSGLHVWTLEPTLGSVEVDGVGLDEWIAALLGDAPFDNVTPPAQ